MTLAKYSMWTLLWASMTLTPTAFLRSCRYNGMNDTIGF